MPIKAKVTGPLHIKASNCNTCGKLEDLYYLIRVPHKEPNCNYFIHCRIARLLKTYRNWGRYEWLNGTQFSLPDTSDRLMALMKDHAVQRLGGGIFCITVVRPDDVHQWNSSSDFRMWEEQTWNFQGVNYFCYRIFDYIFDDGIHDESIYTPKFPRFEVNEIFRYNNPNNQGNEADHYYGKIEKVTNDNMSFGHNKLSIPAYRVRLAKPDVSNEEYNHMFMARDFCKDRNFLYMERLPFAIQTDLRKRIFDPFYRFGGL